MHEEEAIKKIEERLELIPGSEVFEEKLKSLAARINELLNHDFQKLIAVLYRMDINEKKLRRLLDENKDTDAGLIIAHMMIEREAQKIKSRRETSQNNKDTTDEDRW